MAKSKFPQRSTKKSLSLQRKWLNSKLIEKVRLYTPTLEEYLHCQLDRNLEPYLSNLQAVATRFNQFYPRFKNDKTLILLLEEILYQFDDREFVNNELKTASYYLKGSNNLLEALKVAENKAGNVESIVLKVKSKSLAHKALQFKISGVIPIQKIIDLVNTQLAGFEENARLEESTLLQSKKKTTPAGAIKKIYVTGLYRYLQNKLKGRSPRQIKLIGGQILSSLNLLNIPKKLQGRTGQFLDSIYISHFQKYLS